MSAATQYPTITARICAVKSEVGPVPKRGYNSHGNYHHSTTDDVYHALRPLLAKHGLDVRVSIERREMIDYQRTDSRGNVSTAHRLDYEFAIRFEAVDGLVEEESDRRFLSLPYTGPQTDETAMSYASKQWLRQRFQLETGDFESEEALDEGGDNPAAKHQVNSSAMFRTPAGKRIRARIDEVLPKLSPGQVEAVNAAVAAVGSIGDLNVVATNAERQAVAQSDGPKAQPAATPSATTRRPSPADAPPAREGAWWLATAHKIGEDSEGNPEFGAILPPGEVPPDGAPLKVTMRGKRGRMRAVVVEVIEQTDLGFIVVRTRPMTKTEEARVGGSNGS